MTGAAPAATINETRGHRRVATEDAWTPRELLGLCPRELADKKLDDPAHLDIAVTRHE